MAARGSKVDWACVYNIHMEGFLERCNGERLIEIDERASHSLRKLQVFFFMLGGNTDVTFSRQFTIGCVRELVFVVLYHVHRAFIAKYCRKGNIVKDVDEMFLLMMKLRAKVQEERSFSSPFSLLACFSAILHSHYYCMNKYGRSYVVYSSHLITCMLFIIISSLGCSSEWVHCKFAIYFNLY